MVFISWMIFTCIVLKLLHLKWNVSPVSSDPPSPVLGSPSLGPQEWLTSTSGEDLESKPSSYQLSFAVEMAKKQSSTSISSNLKRLLTPSLHLPYSGQQGLAEEHKRRTQSSCIPNNTPGKIELNSVCTHLYCHLFLCIILRELFSFLWIPTYIALIEPKNKNIEMSKQ